MKKLLLILFLSFGIALSSQNYFKFSYDIEDDNIYHDCYHSTLLDDGNVVMLEYFLETDLEDMGGYTLIKLNSKAEMLEKNIIYTESLYDIVESAHIGQTLISYGNSKLINNPKEENSNLFVTVYESVLDGLYHYHAMFFDDDLNLTNVVDTPILLENTTISSFNILLNDNNELVFCVRNSAENNYVFFLMDIYGDLKYMKHTDISTEEYRIGSNSVFMFDKENSHYGCLLRRVSSNGISESGKLTIFVFDDEFNQINEKSLYELNVPSYPFKVRLNATEHNPQMIMLNDGGFALISLCFHDGKRSLVVLKMDKDLNIIGHCFLGTSNFNDFFIYTQYDPIIECKGGSLYALWRLKDDSNIYHSMISRLDKDLNLQWEIKYEEEDFILPILCSSNVMEDGSLVTCGIEFGTYHDYAPVCYIFQHDGTSVTENSVLRPYSYYPNPAEDQINIRFSPDVNVEKVEIFGLDGKLYHEQNFNMETLNVSNLSNGIYMMKVTLDNGEMFTDKIVKN